MLSLSLNYFKQPAALDEGIHFFRRIISNHFFDRSSFFEDLYLPVDLSLNLHSRIQNLKGIVDGNSYITQSKKILNNTNIISQRFVLF